MVAFTNDEVKLVRAAEHTTNIDYSKELRRKIQHLNYELDHVTHAEEDAVQMIMTPEEIKAAEQTEMRDLVNEVLQKPLKTSPPLNDTQKEKFNEMADVLMDVANGATEEEAQASENKKGEMSEVAAQKAETDTQNATG